jgi:uncharacterized protein
MASMKIDVKRYGEDPEELRLVLDAAWVARQLEGVHHTEGLGQGEATLLVSRLGAKVQVTGSVRARFPVACARCLEPAEVSMDEPFVMLFEEAVDRVLPQEVELTEEDLHWETYDGREIDLAPLLREQLLLAVPMTPLCRPDCDGLARHLPRPDGDDAPPPEQPEVDGKPIDPRWNALAKLKPTR